MPAIDWTLSPIKNFPVFCAVLLDQDRYIGSDPVGRSCSNPATETAWVRGLSWRVCASCAELVRAGSDRVTLPNWKAVAASE